jgi:hypothetical protein
MIRLRVIVIVAVCLPLLTAAPASARIDPVKTALRALRIAERAEHAARKNKRVKVESKQIVDGSIGSADLADAAVTAGKLAAGAVTAG